MLLLSRLRVYRILFMVLGLLEFTLLSEMGLAKAESPQKKSAIQWVDWTDDLFEKSKKAKKLVILDLEAIWCHWCHVMEETTYADPKVQKLIADHFIAVRVDQDSRPDLSARYEDFGWPATILFAADGTEIAKRAGYIAPETMLTMLQAFIDDPTPGPSIEAAIKIVAPSSPLLTSASRANQERLFNEAYDTKQGSWGFNQKFLNWAAVELALRKAARGDKAAETKAIQTLAAQKNLIDPVWGGVYQYSTDGVWTERHFEKIMQFQAENLKIYALAYSQFRNPDDLKNTQDIARFLKDFLTSPEGAFYTSQDADIVQGKHSADYFKLDDKARRKKGIPRIDKSLYARENAWAAGAFASAYAASGDKDSLLRAQKSLEWVIKNRSLGNGGFKHGEKPDRNLYLGDTLAVGQAFLTLYSVTGERSWLKRAQDAQTFIDKNFRASETGTAGYLPSNSAAAKSLNLQPNQDENIAMGRFANLLYHYTGEADDLAAAKHSMRFLASPHLEARFSPGVLLLDSELSVTPVHITVVGAKDDTNAAALFAAAIAFPSQYKRIDWYDSREGPLLHNEVSFPPLKTAAAFACSAKRCSLPARTPDEIRQRVAQITKE